jgi:hypothetical protein
LIPKTQLQIWDAKLTKSKIRDVERAAATELGYILIAFGRLDVNLGLACAWKGDGKELETLSESLDERFCSRLQVLQAATNDRYPTGPGRDAYESWIADAHRIRMLRNQMVHCRWGFTHDGFAVSVSGLPNSARHAEQRFTLEELASVHAEIVQLTTTLIMLREAWPP